jgi:hypothetical protein
MSVRVRKFIWKWAAPMAGLTALALAWFSYFSFAGAQPLSPSLDGQQSPGDASENTGRAVRQEE